MFKCNNSAIKLKHISLLIGQFRSMLHGGLTHSCHPLPKFTFVVGGELNCYLNASETYRVYVKSNSRNLNVVEDVLSVMDTDCCRIDLLFMKSVLNLSPNAEISCVSLRRINFVKLCFSKGCGICY